MWPYLHLETPHLGPLPLHPFGAMVALGFLAWDTLCVSRARRLGYDLREFRALTLWGIAVGLVFAHLVEVVFYRPEELLARPASILAIWESMSSVGGMIGCVVGGLLWTRFDWRRGPVRRATPLPLLPYGEVIVATFPLGWALSRLGCAIVHDHPGIAVAAPSWLTVAFPRFAGEGLAWHAGPLYLYWGSDPRYDLGLLECLFSALLACAMGLLWRRRLPLGSYIGVACASYAPVRFALDFLRPADGPAGDRRLGPLTFAQWISIAMLAVGVHMLRRARTRGTASEPAAPPPLAGPPA